MKTEYRQLKDIIPRAIFETHVDLTSEFMIEFIRFVTTYNLGYDEAVSFDELTYNFDYEIEWVAWLIQHGFIEKVVEEVTHSIGDRFLNGESRDKYLLSKAGGDNNIALINLATGNTWAGNIQVGNTSEVTETELKRLTGSWNFTKIEGK